MPPKDPEAYRAYRREYMREYMKKRYHQIEKPMRDVRRKGLIAAGMASPSGREIVDGRGSVDGREYHLALPASSPYFE